MTALQIIQNKIAERTANNLKIVIEQNGPDGQPIATTLYPKDLATKVQWLRNYEKKGIKILLQ
jgi:hypothetical protein